MDSTFKVGDIVASHNDIVSDNEYWSELCASAGEYLVVCRHLYGTTYEVHKVNESPKLCRKFCIRATEVDLVRSVDEDRTNLAYVLRATTTHYGTLEKAWDKVAQILKEFKKRKHSKFYFDVEELSRGRGYMVKVFKDG